MSRTRDFNSRQHNLRTEIVLDLFVFLWGIQSSFIEVYRLSK